MRLMKEEKVLGYTRNGETLFEVTHRVSPLFYRGAVPLTFRSGAFEMSFTTITKWAEFDGFRIAYGISGQKKVPGVGASIAATAVATTSDGEVIARAEVVDLVKGSGFFVEEEHLSAAGDISYAAKSFFTFEGEKQSESEVRGKKAGDYFFLWPT